MKSSLWCREHATTSDQRRRNTNGSSRLARKRLDKPIRLNLQSLIDTTRVLGLVRSGYAHRLKRLSDSASGERLFADSPTLCPSETSKTPSDTHRLQRCDRGIGVYRAVAEEFALKHVASSSTSTVTVPLPSSRATHGAED